MQNILYHVINYYLCPEILIYIELKHFVECVQEDKKPLVTGEDGKAVLEILYAAYESARIGKKVELPFTPRVSKPVDLLWLKG